MDAAPRYALPGVGFGVGLRTAHFGHVLSKAPAVGAFEILSENFLDTGGRPVRVLDQVAERWPVLMHGVSLSIGGTDPLDRGYLRKLAALARRCRARFVTDHLCWTGVMGRNTHDLLPVPYTEEALRHVVRRVRRVQEILERPIALENPSSYVAFRSSTMGEAEFLARVAVEADCGLLLDVNNVHVSARNHGFDAREYLRAIPQDRVVYYHLAGHEDLGTHLLDTHGSKVIDAVWDLYAHAVALSGGRPTIVEWDQDVPEFRVLHGEARRAARVADGVLSPAAPRRQARA